MSHTYLGTRGRVLGGLCLAAALLCTSVTTNAAERSVIMEDFTATWCVFCPDVAQAMNTLMNQFPDTYVGMQIHGDDSYTYPWGNWRRTQFYPNWEGYPTVWTDGVIKRLGGGGGVYGVLLNHYNQRQAVPTDVVLQLGGAEVSGSTYSITCNASIEEDGSAKTLRIYMVQVLDNYPPNEEWPRNCFIQAASTQDVTLQPGEFAVVTREFTFSGASWANQDDIRIIAWAQDPQSTGPAEIHQAEMMTWPFTSLDCNDNGIPDVQDIAEGTSLDCNLNGLPDECDIDSGSEDCDENGIIDTCETRSESTIESGDLGMIGEGFPQQYTIEDPIEQFEPVAVTVRGFGDFSTALENVQLWLNGELIGTAFTSNGADCTVLEEVLEIPADQFNALTAGEDAVFDLIPSSDVFPERCDGSSSISIDVELWVLGSDADQNANGIPDACEELPCPADLDGSGQVDVTDLLELLGDWGQPGPADLDGSGTVEVGDLLILLAAWGEC